MIGVIGGLGPKATATFYLALSELVAARAHGCLPPIAIQSVAMTPFIENAFLTGHVAPNSPESIDVRRLLVDAVERLRQSGAKAIVMPCNTLQEELTTICAEKDILHIDMIAETVNVILAAKRKRVLLLGTSSTLHTDMYGRRLREHGISCVYPEDSAQRSLERIIRDALNLKNLRSSSAIVDIVATAGHDCDGVVLACTDLTGCLLEVDCGKPVFDSVTCLAESSARWILERRERLRS